MKPPVFTGTLVVASAAETTPAPGQPVKSGSQNTSEVNVRTELLLLHSPPALRPMKRPVHIGGGGGGGRGSAARAAPESAVAPADAKTARRNMIRLLLKVKPRNVTPASCVFN